VLIKALRICDIAFEALFEDTKNLVAEGVRANIAHLNENASSDEERQIVLSRGESREKFLRLWLKKPFPLAYGEQDGNEVFKLLVQAISEDDHSVTQGLPNWKTFGTMRGDLAVNLFDMSKPRRALSPKAPVVRNGSFLPVLKVAHESLIDLATNMSVPEAPNEFVTGVLFEALKIFKVQYFPAPKPKTGTAGGPEHEAAL
jgi:hypothetical protein